MCICDLLHLNSGQAATQKTQFFCCSPAQIHHSAFMRHFNMHPVVNSNLYHFVIAQIGHFHPSIQLKLVTCSGHFTVSECFACGSFGSVQVRTVKAGNPNNSLGFRQYNCAILSLGISTNTESHDKTEKLLHSK